jgi:LmbE family N-acetylglucosaminyl deacetylase
VFALVPVVSYQFFQLCATINIAHILPQICEYFPIKTMSENHYHSIYLSPHLDDATLSCGGQIFQQTAAGYRVLIVTITAGDPPVATLSAYARSLQERWALASNAVAARRAEDYAANAILGADTLHWAVPDCIYRLDPSQQTPFYESDADIFGDVHPQEAYLVAQLAAQIRALPPCDQLYAPLTIGHHVDHLLTRAAAEATATPALVYYEDYPYAQKPGAIEQVLAAGSARWQSQVRSWRFVRRSAPSGATGLIWRPRSVAMPNRWAANAIGDSSSVNASPARNRGMSPQKAQRKHAW